MTSYSDASPGYTLATVFEASLAGFVSGVRWYAPTTAPTGTVIGLLYRHSDGAQLASANFGTITTSAWNSVMFASPVAIDANLAYCVSIWTADWYVANSGYFFSAPLTNGHLTAFQDNAAPDFLRNGAYASGASTAHPTNAGGGAFYGVDLVYDVGDATVTPSTIATVAALPSPSVSTGSTVTPAAIATTTSVPGSAESVGSTLDVAAIAGTTTMPAADAHGGVGVTPATVAATAAFPSTTLPAGVDTTPGVIAATAAFPDPTVIAETTLTSPTQTGSWYGLLNILDEARREAAAERAQRPVACPYCGEPLKTGHDSSLYCPFDGWRPTGTWLR
jgi:hypothetical protein